MNPTLEITTMLPCTNMCMYCPQDKIVENYTGSTELSYDGFAAILEKIPKNVRIDWSGFCEPFYHLDAPHMMRLTSEKGYKQVLYTTLSGIDILGFCYLTDSEFELIMVHVPDKVAYTANESKFAADLTNFLKAGFNPQYMAMGEVSQKMKDCVPGHIQMPLMLSRGSNIQDKEVTLKMGRIRCNSSIAGADFDHNVMLPNGDVHLCCMDYSLRYRIGNLFLKNTYTQIMESASKFPLQYIKQQAVDFEDDSLLCRKCEWGELY